MATTRQADAPGRMLGYGGLLLAIVGAASIALLGGNTAIAAAMLGPLVITGVLAAMPALRDASEIWLVTATWTGAIGVVSIFSVGLLFLIATVFLLAALVRANW